MDGATTSGGKDTPEGDASKSLPYIDDEDDDDAFLPESSMDLAPSLLNLFDAVIGKESIRRQEILSGIGSRQKDVDGFTEYTSKGIMPDDCLECEQSLSSCNFNKDNQISLENFPEDLEEVVILEQKRIDKNSNLEMNGSIERIQNPDHGSGEGAEDETDGSVREVIARKKSNMVSASPSPVEMRTKKDGQPHRTTDRKDRPASAEILMDVKDFVVVDSASIVNDDAVSQMRHRKSSRINPPIQLIPDYAGSPHSSPPPSPPPSPKHDKGISYLSRIVHEIVETEHKYVNDLAAIIESYLEPIKDNSFSPLTEEKFNILFCNLKEIYAFNKEFLDDLEGCKNNPEYVAECFIESEENFSIYTTYCTNYPEAVKVLTECANNEIISRYFRDIQSRLGHGLPLGAYLLKPVQRILKYHLLFQDMCKHYNQDEQGYETICDALESMVEIARHINEMKRKHEAAIHVQEIQSQLHGMEENLTSYGDLVLEDTFRMRRAERYLYLFEKALLICKRDDSLLTMKACIKCSNLMLCESLPKEPLAFNVVPFDQPSIQYTILAKTAEQKKIWTHEIKRLILENYQSSIPAKVKDLILKATTPEDEADKSPSQNVDVNFNRNKKDRKSGRKNRRRNSEPIGKHLQRGQKQVKAAVESFLTGMKRPDLSKLGQRSSDITEGGASPNDSHDERMEDLTEENEIPEEPVDRVPSVAITSMEGGEEITTVMTPPDHLPLASSLSHFSQGSESKRDSGIGSMTITETPKSETDEKSENEMQNVGKGDLEYSPGKLSPRGAGRKASSRKQRRNSGRKEDEEDAIEEMIKGTESPDELEALENLSEEIEDVSDMEEQKLLKRQRKMIDDAFRLRHADMKQYRRMLKKSEAVWEKKKHHVSQQGSKFRERSASHSITRSADSSPNPHPHLLLRAVSEDSRLAAFSAWTRTHSYSDPNIAGSAGSISGETIEESSKESSVASLTVENLKMSNENLAETIDDEFKKLEAKYSHTAHLDKSDSEDTTTGVAEDSSEGTGSLPSESLLSEEKSMHIVEVPVSETPHRVFSLARKYSIMAKEQQQPSSFKSVRQMKARESRNQVKSQADSSSISEVRPKPRRPSKSDPFAERDGTRAVITVSENKDGTKCVITNAEGSQRLSQSILWRNRHGQRSGDPIPGQSSPVFVEDSDDDFDDDSAVFVRGGHRRSVKDKIKGLESKKDVRHEPHGATPYQAPSIRERLRSMQEQIKSTNLQVQSKGRVGSTKFKSLQERLQELEQSKEKPIEKQRLRIKASSFSSDFTDSSSVVDEQDGGSSESSSRRSSCGSASFATRRSASLALYDLGKFCNSTENSSSRSSIVDEDISMPFQFKSLRERFEELEKAISKPVPKTVDPLKIKTFGRSFDSGSETDTSKSSKS